MSDDTPRFDWNIPRNKGSKLSLPVISNGRRIGVTELASGTWSARCEAFETDTGGRLLAAWSTSPNGSEGAIVFTGDMITIIVTAELCAAAAWQYAHYTIAVQGPGDPGFVLLSGTMRLVPS